MHRADAKRSPLRASPDPRTQVTLLKQEKVPCLSDNEARLSTDPKDPFRLLTKPHGHGDVHFLLHSSGTIDKWEQAHDWRLDRCTIACTRTCTGMMISRCC